MARRKILATELATIAQLFEIGKSDQEIAADLGWKHKDAVRTVSKQRLKMGISRRNADTANAAESKAIAKNKLLETMTKDERFNFLKVRFSTNPRNQLVFQTFSKEEADMFLDQYYNVLQSTDSITEAEEQQLFAAMVEYVLAYRVLRMKSEEEKCVEETLKGEHESDDPRYKLRVDKRYDEEYHSHLNNYKEFMSEGKMSRRQRLDKVKSERRTLIDIASELSTNTAQALAADEIERLSILSNEELAKMIKEGHILGDFGAKP
jgi:hypothetical protein